jgi:hypothetical protein
MLPAAGASRRLPISRASTILRSHLFWSAGNMKLRPAFAAELAVNLLLPWAAYRLALPHWGEVGGLIASAVPPTVWSIVGLVRFRRLDALSAIVLVGIALSLGAMALGGSARMLLMRESLASGAIGLAFLLSLFARRPLGFYLARASAASSRPRCGC